MIAMVADPTNPSTESMKRACIRSDAPGPDPKTDHPLAIESTRNTKMLGASTMPLLSAGAI
jgi:hypothetical protein